MTSTPEFFSGSELRMLKLNTSYIFCMAAATTVVMCKQFKINPFFWHATGIGQAALIPRKFIYLFLAALQEAHSKCLGVFWIAEIQSL